MFSWTNLTFLKPLIPRILQIKFRRALAKKAYLSARGTWPIDPKSSKPPDGWKGWPDNKKFALVITHDVDTAEGHDQCMQLAEMEKRHGFRSSFNFVAEDYKISDRLINDLRSDGFEIGSHSIRHKNPFKSPDKFPALASQINHYLKEWDAVGFRSPSMYHNMDLLHHLNIEYDASTFDTDPFEPQPDGIGTIFPFWVKDQNNHKGYVELPYTLPQDFLLFIILQQKNIEIWKKKLDWIAENGGMALFIIHPDYMNFNNKPHYEKYPAHYYEDFLNYIKTKYEGQYWHALPKDVARFWSANYKGKTILPAKRKHICMLAYSFYESDNRIMRYADALAQRGDTVDVIALRSQDTTEYENIKNVNVYRIQKRMINEKHKITYLYRLTAFLFRSSLFITHRHFKYPYDLIHVHSVPDFEVFAALLPKLNGAKIILDIHDIVPEFYASKFSGGKDSLFFKALVKIEQLSIKFSDHVIISNHLWHKTLTNRSVEKDKCTAVMNYPDESIFYQRPKTRADNKFIMLYPGTLGWHQGLDIAIKAFAKIKDRAEQAEFHIYGRGTETDNLEKLIVDLKLTDRVFIKDPMPIDQIAEVMANADLGIIPKKNDPFGGEAFSTKTLEFMSLGIPIVLSKTKIDQYYFNDSVVKFFIPDNVDDLADAMLTMIENRELRETLRNSALHFVEDYRWSKRKNEYFDLVDSLIRQRKS